MEFNLGKDNKCIKCSLEPLSGGETVEIRRIKFNKESVLRIAKIMEQEVKNENRELMVDSFSCKMDELNKFEFENHKIMSAYCSP